MNRTLQCQKEKYDDFSSLGKTQYHRYGKKQRARQVLLIAWDICLDKRHDSSKEHKWKKLIQVHETTDYGKSKREFDLKTYFLEYDSYSKIQREAKTNKQLVQCRCLCIANHDVQGTEYQQFKLLSEHPARYISCSKYSQGNEMAEKAHCNFTPLNTAQKASKDVWLDPAGSSECTTEQKWLLQRWCHCTYKYGCCYSEGQKY